MKILCISAVTTIKVLFQGERVGITRALEVISLFHFSAGISKNSRPCNSISSATVRNTVESILPYRASNRASGSWLWTEPSASKVGALGISVTCPQRSFSWLHQLRVHLCLKAGRSKTQKNITELIPLKPIDQWTLPVATQGCHSTGKKKKKKKACVIRATTMTRARKETPAFPPHDDLGELSHPAASCILREHGCFRVRSKTNCSVNRKQSWQQTCCRWLQILQREWQGPTVLPNTKEPAWSSAH